MDLKNNLRKLALKTIAIIDEEIKINCLNMIT